MNSIGRSSKARLLAVSVTVGVVLAGWVGQAADDKPATNAIPKSIFVKDPAGRDPFDPNAGGAQPVPVPSAFNICDTIRITGIAGSGTNLMASVQGVPLRGGETAKIKGTDGVVREWEVKEIREDDVLMQTGSTVCTVVIQKRAPLSITGPEKGK